jgi:hypothetical protein
MGTGAINLMELFVGFRCNAVHNLATQRNALQEAHKLKDTRSEAYHLHCSGEVCPPPEWPRSSGL